jgi:lactase-phlorizin hydrolase
MKEFIGRKSTEEGRRWSRLPQFTQEEINLIKGTSDFLALNYYSSGLSADLKDHPDRPNLADSDNEIWGAVHPDWVRAKSTWLFSAPEGLHDLLVWIKDNYNNVKVYITENGWSDEPGTIEDDGRVKYLNDHLSAISRAISVENCNIQAYTVWSLVDNFEWMMGLTERFGIFAVDFNDPEKKREPKKSVGIFRNLTQNYWIDTDWVYINRNDFS